MPEARLDLVPPEPDAYARALLRAVAAGTRRIRLQGVASGALVGPVLRLLSERGFPTADPVTLVPDAPLPSPAPAVRGAVAADPSADDIRDVDDSAVRVVFADTPDDLRSRLAPYVDRPAHVVAPRLDSCAAPLVAVTIPKSGTHLLLELLTEFGYEHDGFFPGTPQAGRYYFLGGTSHVDVPTLLTLPFLNNFDGGYSSALWDCPVLLMYRNPLDIVCSEINWYAKPGNTYLAHHLARFEPGEVARRLIEGDRHLLDLHGRVRHYFGWLDFHNTIPVSYEELVGAQGGGDADLQTRLIWSLQVKLQIAGDPANFGRVLARRGGRTFHKGRIGRFRETLGPEHLEAARRLPPETFAAFGYDLDRLVAGDLFTAHAQRNRARPWPDEAARPPRTSGAAGPAVPPPAALPDADARHPDVRHRAHGFFIYPYREMFVAFPEESVGLRFPEDLGAPGVLVGLDFDEIRALVARRARNDAPLVTEPNPGVFVDSGSGCTENPVVLGPAVRGANLVAFRGRIYAVPRRLGPIDFFDPAQLASRRILQGDDLDALLRRLGR